ncbi:MAG: DUF2076 domain-containing protein [Pantoea sp.]|uniref:DUF2076 domain-containing protein n=1 Tax=Pantoea septica TaxID=472695 RepID=UPI001C1194EE|nr:DUF2076 domain-containing protein [Pantoea septica]MBU5377150.1 DUF2076 domain-containing protein [Pantoea septica]MDU5837841.1 DUF2076 domain-containing protein [Pantoea sp.]MDU6441251.1 DUF2076 domain-containing protein [Pantoea sp.]
MYSQEHQLIEGLFSRLKQAESQTGPRDAAAEQLIKEHLQQQPGAPYYMAQAILIQEAAMKKMNDRITELENRLAQQQQQQQPQQQSSGGFLSSLFGGGSRQQAPAQQQQPQQQAWNNAPQQPQYNNAPAAPARGTGFLGGALQTAVGVAGGVVMADMLTSLFHHSQPEEIVNIINEPDTPLPQVDENLDTFNSGGSGFLDQNNGWDNNYADNNDFNDLGNDSFDGFNDDDDSFV